MFIIAELKNEKGEPITILTVQPKVFKTGSRGYYANANAVIEGKRYQIQVQMVEIGSKNQETTSE